MGSVKQKVVSERVRNGRYEGGRGAENRGKKVTRSMTNYIFLLYLSRVLRYMYITSVYSSIILILHSISEENIVVVFLLLCIHLRAMFTTFSFFFFFFY